MTYPIPAPAQKSRWLDLTRGSLPWALAQNLPENTLKVILTQDVEQALRVQTAWQFFRPSDTAVFLPDWETLPYERFSPHQDLVSERLSALWQVKSGQADVLIVPVATAMQKLTPVSFLLGRTFWLKTGQTLDIEALRGNLVEAGYSHVSNVVATGEFAVRGGILDIFPMGSEWPYRLDLFGDEIDSIKTFDPDNQRTLSPVSEIRLLPAHEFPTDDDAQKIFRARFREEIHADYHAAAVYKAVSSGHFGAGVEYYLPLFFEHELATLFDYIGGDAMVVCLGDVHAEASRFWADVKSRFAMAQGDETYPPLHPQHLYLSEDQFAGRLKPYPQILPDLNGNSHALPDVAVNRQSETPLAALQNFQAGFGGRILLCAESAGRRETMLGFFAQHGLKPKSVDSWQAFLDSDAPLAITVTPLAYGFQLPSEQAAGAAALSPALPHGGGSEVLGTSNQTEYNSNAAPSLHKEESEAVGTPNQAEHNSNAAPSPRGGGLGRGQQTAGLPNAATAPRLPENHACFVAGTLVHTDKGLVPIEQIKVGDRVLSRDEHNPHAENVYQPVTNTLKTEQAEVVAIQYLTTEKFEYLRDHAEEPFGFITPADMSVLVCTPNHPFGTHAMGWISAADLDPYDDDDSPVTFDQKIIKTYGHLERGYAALPVFATDVPHQGWFSNHPEDTESEGEILDFSGNQVSIIQPASVHGQSGVPYPIQYEDFEDYHFKKYYKTTVYNLEVANTHTYFVGAEGIWVHNCSTAPALREQGQQTAALLNVTPTPRLPENHACFVAGTLVHTDKGLVPIEQIQVGDRVLSRDAQHPDGENVYKRVTSTFKSTEKKRIIYQSFDTRHGTGYLFCSEDHPFWTDRLIQHDVDENGAETLLRKPIGWTAAIDLEGAERHALRTFDHDVAYVSTFEDRQKLLGAIDADPDCKIVRVYNPSDAMGIVDFRSGKPVILKGGGINFNSATSVMTGALLPTEAVHEYPASDDHPDIQAINPLLAYGVYDHEYHDYVYNIEVADTHTYFVGHTGIWVHNCSTTPALREQGQQTAALLNVAPTPRPPENHACFVAGTLVHTDKGLVPIEQIQVGDRVLSRDAHHPDGENIYKQVTSTFKSTEKKRIIYQSFDTRHGTGYLFCSEDHPFWTDRLIQHDVDESGAETLLREPIGWTAAIDLEGAERHALRTFDHDVAYVSTYWAEHGLKLLGTAFPDSDCQVVFLYNTSSCAGTIDFSAGRPVIVYNDNLGVLLPTEECSDTLMTPQSRAMSANLLATEGKSFGSGYYQDYHDYVYNIEVADTHTYFVGHTGIWVHNCTPAAAGRLNTPIAVITESDLYQYVARSRNVRRRKHASVSDGLLRDLAEINIGDPVVHEEHGIGRYMGLVGMDLGEGINEMMLLEYAGEAQLYVPVSQLHLISRYSGQAHENVHLHKLGSGAWTKAKRKAAEKARDTAAELLNLYAQRAAQEGFKFAFNEQDYQAFADGFGYEETEDQAAAIGAVLKDLTQGKPMDRLVCGDVGFGKTEVALRAAFVAVMGGKQVALLAPTTLLVEQHAQNFADRFADFPVKVASLSRFNSGKTTTATLKGMAEGTVDIVIGTHKLVQDDIQFKNLGLVIIDEEHRFGVRQKEQLKRLRANVDILTLTATPIPRTLSMALEGLRDFSLITTAPSRRLAVKTFVKPFSEGSVREAVLRELKRGGQVFFLHNEVDTIANMHERLQELLPEARIGIAHGQLRERELEQVMRDFLQQRFNVLLCSTIIETGIDIPNANTIIINRADKFGLAQLHQLRGRVGRSHHQAYAYLLTPEYITKDAEKRLDAIAAADELGAGFTLAMQDLEIRGAGEILGEGQSGEMIQVGFTLYTEMLKQAVRDLKKGRQPDLDAPLGVTTEIKLHSPALLPESYCPDIHERLVLYKRLATCETEAQINSVHEELVDRFGLPEQPVKTLIESHRIRLVAKEMGIDAIDATGEAATFTFGKHHSIDPTQIIMLMQSNKNYRLAGPDRLRVSAVMDDVETRIQTVKTVLKKLAEK